MISIQHEKYYDLFYIKKMFWVVLSILMDMKDLQIFVFDLKYNKNSCAA